MRHPEPAELEQASLDDEVADHLRVCAACRVDRRMLRAGAGPVSARSSPPSDRSSAVLTASWRSLRSDALRSPTPRAPRHRRGEPLGDYVIDALIGEGGMAAVYQAHHAASGQRVALKILHNASGDLGRRLAREALLQGRLEHEGVVSALEFIESDHPVLVLELIDGPSLDAVLKGPLLPLAIIDCIAGDVLAALAAAHRADVVHRDLKPANILLAPTQDGFRARVADFGLARLSGDAHLDSLRTRSGALIGTPAYMAPEQLREARSVDARSDVWAAGALLYELITGCRALAGVDFVDVVERVTGAVTTPVAELRPDIPERWRVAVEAALQTDRERRPKDAAALEALWWAGVEPSDEPWPQDLVERIKTLHLESQPPPLALHVQEPAMRWGRWLAGLALAGAAAGALAASLPTDHAVVVLTSRSGEAAQTLEATQVVVWASPVEEQVEAAACMAESLLVPNIAQTTGRVGSGCPRAPDPGGKPVALTRAVPDLEQGQPVEDFGELRLDRASPLPGTWLPQGERELTLVNPWTQEALDDSLRTPAPITLSSPDPSEALRLEPGEQVLLEWVASGGPPLLLEIRPRDPQLTGLVVQLEDDGEHQLAADTLPFGEGPGVVDLVLVRREEGSRWLGLKRLRTIARSEVWLTVVRAPEGRGYLERSRNCLNAEGAAQVEPGRYWILLDGLVGGNWNEAAPTCGVEADNTGKSGDTVSWHRVRVPAGRTLAVTARAQDQTTLHLLPSLCRDATTCVGSEFVRDGNGRVSARLPPDPSNERYAYLAAGTTADQVQGLLELDIGLVGPVDDQQVHLDWSTTDEGSRMRLRIDQPADTAYRLGMAETHAGELGWYREDCIGDKSTCHQFGPEGVELETVSQVNQVEPGRRTLLWTDAGQVATTYFLEALTLNRCWVWGHDPEHFAERGCEVWESVDGRPL